MISVPWTKEEENILKKMAQKGCSDSEIALVLRRRTKNGVRVKRAALNLQQYRYLPAAEIDMAAFNLYMKEKK
jgi:hypothetical protein